MGRDDELRAWECRAEQRDDFPLPLRMKMGLYLIHKYHRGKVSGVWDHACLQGCLGQDFQDKGEHRLVAITKFFDGYSHAVFGPIAEHKPASLQELFASRYSTLAT